eukprot:CAMPEP_0185729150 /NCGR_PEP_ID=MMETSP1171-20130828/4492_1 /TAXON_ID=374046 /ORGANISM="Helicotheca tamensis, Strain CCMP826" /LENGTH=385 /DNA_ID=CAMNT_0028397927 /DNA_START=133 /DNA_END=1290 /DNA_ORIENTATION=+
MADAFGDELGKIRGVYKCAFGLEDGHLAVGSKSIGYRSTDFGNERKIMVHYGDINSLSAVNASDISISTLSGEGYVFKGFDNRDTVLKLLKDNKEKMLLTAPDEAEPASKSQTKALRRRSSFPTIPVHALPTAEIEEDDLQGNLRGMGEMTLSIDQQKVVDTAEKEGKMVEPQAPPPSSRSKSMRFFSNVAKTKSPREIEKAWAKLKTEKSKTYPNTVLDDVKLNYTVDEFYKIFWSNNATCPQENFKRDVQGDKDIVTTEWIDTGDKFTLGRSQQYLHPNDAPMGPPMANSVTEQTLQKYGDHGMQISFSTTVEGVPMADCFVMEDRILADATKGGINVRVDMGLRFVKRTMWKSVIQTAAKGGSKKSWQQFVKYVKELPDYPK